MIERGVQASQFMPFRREMGAISRRCKYYLMRKMRWAFSRCRQARESDGEQSATALIERSAGSKKEDGCASVVADLGLARRARRAKCRLAAGSDAASSHQAP